MHFRFTSLLLLRLHYYHSYYISLISRSHMATDGHHACTKCDSIFNFFYFVSVDLFMCKCASAWMAGILQSSNWLNKLRHTAHTPPIGTTIAYLLNAHVSRIQITTNHEPTIIKIWFVFILLALITVTRWLMSRRWVIVRVNKLIVFTKLMCLRMGGSRSCEYHRYSSVTRKKKSSSSSTTWFVCF